MPQSEGSVWEGSVRNGVGSNGSATEHKKVHWLAAMRWHRRVTRALSSAQLTFTQWQVLDAAHALITETGDAVSQNQIAARTELDRATVSQVMAKLERKSFVDRGISFTGRAWRVWVTDEAICVLDEYKAAIEDASSNGA